ncbi:thioredoxin reductase [Aeropyrum pernix]|uniref:Thioredoxin reductase n=1 Tax=Aeropyrum pernix TaxID=56636 RepID=A0A401HBK4_AERPX|nr:thioredoxin-disulfide reductase [Aeropyrum pernix]GBF09699.1 thioredoxin reductase [Aeropyrum pernix]
MPLRLSAVRAPKIPRGEEYDTVIVGAGPAGLSAAIYTTRFLMSTLIVSMDVGGQLNLTNWIDDYPGMGGLEASKLVESFKSHAEMFGAKIVTGVQVKTVDRLDDSWFLVRGSRGLEVKAHTVILAVGSRRRKLGVPGEAELAGRGVSYCSVCDAPLFKGKDAVVVVGGGDSALEGALLLSGYVGKVYLVHRRQGFRAKPFYVEEARKKPNIEFILDSIVTEIRGRDRVESVVVKNKVTGEEKELKVDGIFIEIGSEPPKELFEAIGLETDSMGNVVVDEWMRTSIPGIFAAGDCTSMWPGFRQVVTAAAMGAVAAYSAYTYLQEKGLYKPKPLTGLK